MRTSRLEAFSDGVLAIIITIMVLELKVPEEPSLEALAHSVTGFATYLLSFVYVGIYWNNHHHMFQIVETVNGAVLWANLHLLFWLSLYPFTTAWMDDTARPGLHLEQTPVVVYGVNLLMAGIAYYVLQRAIFRCPGGEVLRSALGRDLKGKSSPLIYLLGIGLTLVDQWLGIACFVAVAVMWLLPDRRVERFVAASMTRTPDTEPDVKQP
jgi:uncharacterized membrane protein